MTLNLKAADSTKKITVTVGANTDGIKSKIKDFVAQYNNVINYINTQFSYDTETKESGVLFGDFTLQQIQEELRNKILDQIPGLPSSLSSLSQIGLTTNTKDELVFDETAFDKVLSADPTGVMKLFSEVGETTDYSIGFDSATNVTAVTGANGGYKVRIDLVATQARITASVAQTEALTADETLTINGKTISLTTGMSADEVVAEINRNSSTTGVVASRTGSDGTGTGNYLTLKRAAYGSGYSMTVVSSVSNGGPTPTTNTSGIGIQQVTEMAFLGEAGTGTGEAGKDVTGAFGVTVDGVTTWESTTGKGQYLTGNTGNDNTEGLKVKVTSNTTGEHGEVNFTRGVGGIFNNLLDYLTNKTGAVTTTQETLNKQIEDLKENITTKTSWLADYEEQLRLKFADLESNLSEMKNQGDYLTAQFQAMNKSSK
jgi:flagellar hook-associated protein 2